MSDLNAKSVHEIIRLAEHLQVNVSGCYEKRELIERIVASPLVETIEEPTDSARGGPMQSAATKLMVDRALQHKSTAAQELAQRLADCHCSRVSSTPSSPAAVGSLGDLAGQIMAELRQTAARLDFQLNEGAANADPSQHRSCLTSVGQSIVGNSATSGGA